MTQLRASSLDRNNTIYSAVTSSFPVDEVNIIKRKTVMGKLQRGQQKQLNVFDVFQDDIPEHYLFTIRGERSLMHYSGLNNPNRSLLYSIPQNIEHLMHTNVCLGDGTFKVCSSNFYQFFTIHSTISTKQFHYYTPCVW